MKTEQSKSDMQLGDKVHTYLTQLGVETPMFMEHPGTNTASKLMRMEEAVATLMGALCLDLQDDSLCETPKRVAKMFLHELCWGLDYKNFPKATVVDNKMQVDEMVVERNISVKSVCEHHLLPIVGGAHIAYIPRKKVLGLSKLNRVVEFFSRRPQIQERLTTQICETLKFILDTPDVAVFIEAEHMCVKLRGVEDACSDTATSKLSGVFKSDARVRSEFFSIISMGKR